MTNVPTIELSKCDFRAHCGLLTLPSEYIGMPTELKIRSHHTGKIVRFRTVGPNHSMYNEDGYDGEQTVYEPLDPVNNIKALVIYHMY